MGVEKFVDPEKTIQGKPRAVVPLTDLKTLWINTGTRCNLQCENCYIESTPTNDSLEYITSKQVQTYLDEIYQLNLQTKEIGLTGGEPFLNPNLIKIITLCLERNFNLLILTNGYKVIDRYKDQLQFLNSQYHNQLNLRFSLDHYSLEVHEKERGSGTFHPTLRNIKWFAEQGFNISIAGRSLIHEKMATALHGYGAILKEYNIELDVNNTAKLTIFPEMTLAKDVPEISTECWSILKKSPRDIMCSSSRMVVKRKGEENPKVLSCTLLAYDKRFELGSTLKESLRHVSLNHRYCSEFCVLGGASCN